MEGVSATLMSAIRDAADVVDRGPRLGGAAHAPRAARRCATRSTPRARAAPTCSGCAGSGWCRTGASPARGFASAIDVAAQRGRGAGVVERTHEALEAAGALRGARPTRPASVPATSMTRDEQRCCLRADPRPPGRRARTSIRRASQEATPLQGGPGGRLARPVHARAGARGLLRRHASPTSRRREILTVGQAVDFVLAHQPASRGPDRPDDAHRLAGSPAGAVAAAGVHACLVDRAARRLLRAAGLPGRLRARLAVSDPSVPAPGGRALRRRAADEDPRAGGLGPGLPPRWPSGWGCPSGCGQPAPERRLGPRRRGRAGAHRARVGVDRRRRSSGRATWSSGFETHRGGGGGGVRAGDRATRPERPWTTSPRCRSAGPARRDRRLRGHGARRARRTTAASRWRRRWTSAPVGAGSGRSQEGRRAGGRAGGARALDRGGTREGELVHLKSITLKGFKSFPDRTRLDFGPGVSVIVGPERLGQVERHRRGAVGDGRAVAAGRPRPVDAGRDLRRRARVQARGAAEVEIVHRQRRRRRSIAVRARSRSCAGWTAPARASTGSTAPAAGWSTSSRCSRTPAWARRCTRSSPRAASRRSSPPSRRDRRLLIEEAAGLGKHRKRRRRAQLKLERTQDNLDRALDVEREARSRLRPLKRQAEAAELHERLERQTLEARWELARDAVRARAPSWPRPRGRRRRARGPRRRPRPSCATVAARREEAEQALAERARAARGAGRRALRARGRPPTGSSLRLERRARARRRRSPSARAPRAPSSTALRGRGGARTRRDEGAARAHRRARGRARAARAERAARAGARARGARGAARRRRRRARRRPTPRRQRAARRVAAADEAAERARAARTRGRARGRGRAPRGRRVGAELAAVNQFLRTARRRAGRRPRAGRRLQVDAGLRARAGGRARRRGCAPRWSRTYAAPAGPARRPATTAGAPSWRAVSRARRRRTRAAASTGAAPRPPGSARLDPSVAGTSRGSRVALALLGDAWVVEESRLPDDFTGIAVTQDGRAWFGGARELRQVPAGGEERVLAERNRRDGLVAASRARRCRPSTSRWPRRRAEAGGRRRRRARARPRPGPARRPARPRRGRRGRAPRRMGHRSSAARLPTRAPARSAAPQVARRARRRAPAGRARRRASAPSARGARRPSARRRARRGVAPAAERLAEALTGAAARSPPVSRASTPSCGRPRGRRQLAAELRACAAAGGRGAARLRRARRGGHRRRGPRPAGRATRAAEAQHELGALAEHSASSPSPPRSRSPDEEREPLEQRIERLQRRREQLGPVNPLAKARVRRRRSRTSRSSRRQREDLETALRELPGSSARPTARSARPSRRRSTPPPELRGGRRHLFPGGRGRLRLVARGRPARAPCSVAPRSRGDQAEEPDEREDEPAEEDARRRDRAHPAGQVDQAPVAALRRREVADRARLPVRGLPRPPVPVLHPRRGRGRARRPQHRPLPDLLRRYADRAQFIVVTHQKRTMEAADSSTACPWATTASRRSSPADFQRPRAASPATRHARLLPPPAAEYDEWYPGARAVRRARPPGLAGRGRSTSSTASPRCPPARTLDVACGTALPHPPPDGLVVGLDQQPGHGGDRAVAPARRPGPRRRRARRSVRRRRPSSAC